VLIKHENTSHRELFSNRLLWVRFAIAVSAALLMSLCSGGPAETSEVDATRATVWGLAEPDNLVTAAQGDDTTAFREEEAGFSAHHRVPDHFQDDGQDDLRPRLNVAAITDALLGEPSENSHIRSKPGSHVDSGANFGIIELPMAVTRARGTLTPIQQVTVYYDDRGWVVAYLPTDAPAAGIWRYDPQDTPNAPGHQINDLDQSLLLLAINEVLAAAKRDVPEIVDADQDTVGYYHWQYPDYNAFVLFGHEYDGETSAPVRFVVPPTIENILASASVLITSIPTDDQPAVTAELMVDDSAMVSVRHPARLAVSGFTLERTGDASRLYEITISVTPNTTAAAAMMLVYTKPDS
jgi:hypothetical protein